MSTVTTHQLALYIGFPFWILSHGFGESLE